MKYISIIVCTYHLLTEKLKSQLGRKLDWILCFELPLPKLFLCQQTDQTIVLYADWYSTLSKCHECYDNI